jgi:ABC-type spermidine/putrescine transport system permease subunit II
LTDQTLPAEKPQPQGIGGWLLLLAIGLCLAPIRTLIDLGRSAEEYGRVWDMANGKMLVVAELSINLVVLVLQVVTAVALLNKQKRFRALFAWLWIAAVLLPVLDVVLVLALFPQIPADASVGEIGRAGITFVVMGLWVCYVMVSKRVANTCTN